MRPSPARHLTSARASAAAEAAPSARPTVTPSARPTVSSSARPSVSSSGRPSDSSLAQSISRHPSVQWRSIADLGAIDVMLQPIVSVTTGTVVAAEALARFPSQPGASVEAVFGLAHLSGWGPQLEAACLRVALRKRYELPEGVLLSVNVSPDALQHPEVRHALRGDLRGIAVEITEKSATDSEALVAAMNEIRHRGGLIAIDDASTGYAGLLRLSTLRPDIVKLDRGLVTGARDNDVQAVVIEALVSLTRRIGARTLGEGVETLDDLTMLAQLDVDYAQGWAIGRPAAAFARELPDVAEVCRRARRNLLDVSAGFDEDLRGTASITAALAASTATADVRAALTTASADLGVDVIGLSTLTKGGVLREITATGADVDPREYQVSDFPATNAALQAGAMIEAHVDDPHSDPAERALLARDGFASLLVTPVMDEGTALGILEFSNYTHHRWTRHDLMQARTVAEHLAGTLRRLGEAAERSA
jgi:EAL domain-containing protein (putative c-di-GMP-specific phosphodiesterase class I)